MIARVSKALNKKDGDKGFTLIELLVVIIIIGILSAIAIPLFLNQRKKAEDSAAKADVSTIGKEVATYFVDWDGTTPPVVTVVGDTYELNGEKIGNKSANVELTAGNGGTDTAAWCVSVVNDKGDKATTANGGFSYSAAEGLQNKVCP